MGVEDFVPIIYIIPRVPPPGVRNVVQDQPRRNNAEESCSGNIYLLYLFDLT